MAPPYDSKHWLVHEEPAGHSDGPNRVVVRSVIVAATS